MSWLRDFNKLHIDIKGYVFGILLITPFWYVSIYLFHKDFFNSSPIYLPIVFSYCLTICSGGFGLLISSTIFSLTNIEDKKSLDEWVNFMGIFITIFVIALSIVISKTSNYNFYAFAKIVFYVEFGLLAIVSLVSIIKNIIALAKKA